MRRIQIPGNARYVLTACSLSVALVATLVQGMSQTDFTSYFTNLETTLAGAASEKEVVSGGREAGRALEKTLIKNTVIYQIVLADARGRVVTTVDRTPEAPDPGRNVKKEAWFQYSGIRKKPAYSHAKTDKLPHLLDWSVPIVEKGSDGKLTSKGALLFRIDFVSCLQELAESVDQPFQARLADTAIYSKDWESVPEATDVGVFVKGTKGLTIRADWTGAAAGPGEKDGPSMVFRPDLFARLRIVIFVVAAVVLFSAVAMIAGRIAKARNEALMRAIEGEEADAKGGQAPAERKRAAKMKKRREPVPEEKTAAAEPPPRQPIDRDVSNTVKPEAVLPGSCSPRDASTPRIVDTPPAPTLAAAPTIDRDRLLTMVREELRSGLHTLANGLERHLDDLTEQIVDRVEHRVTAEQAVCEEVVQVERSS